MKSLVLFTTLLLLTLSPLVSSAQGQGNDTVWVFVDHVKADKREQYEKFIEDFWAASTKLKGREREVFSKTRTLRPAKADADGTYPYAFLMDPVVTGGEYSIEALLVMMHGQEKGRQEFQKYLDSVQGGSEQGQTGYIWVEKRHKTQSNRSAT
ncbi:MAG TPA: hypothetical protein VF646_09900, partial [Cytophagales bacterium]